MKLFGAKESFAVGVAWDDSLTTTAADATRGTLELWIAGASVWGQHGLCWTWVELLEHLARFWPDLLVEEGDPLCLGLPPESLRAEAEKRWSEASGDREEAEDELLFGYLEAHDLAAGLKGVFPPALFVTREGNTMRFASRGEIAVVARTAGEATLVAVGDAIAERLANVSDQRATAAVASWRRREDVDPQRLASLASGGSADDLSALGDLLAANDFATARESNELLAVARMSSSVLPAADTAALLAWVKAQPQVWTAPFDRHAEAARALLEARADERPYDQGAAVARDFRKRLGVSPSARLDPVAILADWKIGITDLRLSTRHLDAVCTWGPRHGPAIAVNRLGLHGRFLGRRATLAHEIGHILMDRSAALPLGEVLGGHVPLRIEQRARAFAAELLVTQSIAVAAMRVGASVDATVRQLSRDYGASTEIVAWQIRNGWGGPLPHELYSQLRSYVRDVTRF